MIITTAEYRSFIPTTETDDQITFRIEAAESFICNHTNNEFIDPTTGEKAYPADVKMGVINLLLWDHSNRDKVGISSETISRHSVTYDKADGAGSGGYPSGLVTFLKPYYKARF